MREISGWLLKDDRTAVAIPWWKIATIRVKEEEMHSGMELPNIARADAGAVVVSEFTVGTPERQRTVGEEIVSGLREGASWPEGLISANLFASTDGDTVLSYDQWASNKAYRRFLSGQNRMKANRVDLGISESGLSEPVDYRQDATRSQPQGPRRLYRPIAAADPGQVRGT